MSGGEPTEPPHTKAQSSYRGPPTEQEESMLNVNEEEDDGDDVAEESLKVKKGKEGKADIVVDKANQQLS